MGQQFYLFLLQDNTNFKAIFNFLFSFAQILLSIVHRFVTISYRFPRKKIKMINAKKIEDIAKQVTDSIPVGLKDFATELEDKTKIILQRKLSQLDVVTREEFDVQTQVLIKTRSKLTELEAKVAQLEALLSKDND